VASQNGRQFRCAPLAPFSLALCAKGDMVAKKELNTVQEVLFWSYANLAMAHTAVDRKQEKYATFNYMIRAKLFKGLIEGTMNIRTLFDDEKVKLLSGTKCSYCGSTENLALDHIFAKKLGGKDAGDNLIYACRSCNSSKGKKDMMEWMSDQNSFPPLMILRRYLKLVVSYCIENNLMECQVNEVQNQRHPFNIKYIPVSFPKPSELVLVVE
jgi:hypothetical protein